MNEDDNENADELQFGDGMSNSLLLLITTIIITIINNRIR